MSQGRRCAAGASLLALTMCALAQPARELALDLGAERLSGDRAGWQRQALEGVLRLDDRRTLTGALVRTKRFGLVDTQAGAGVHWPAAGLQVSASAWHSTTSRVLPRWDAGAQAMLPLGGGWQAGAGWRRKLYRSETPAGPDTQGLHTLEAMAERYIGDYRLAWTGGLSRLDGGGRAFAHRMQADRYYGQGSRVSLVLAAGREIERVGGDGLLRSRIRAVSVYGTHWLDGAWRDWALQWELAWHRQGMLYERTGARLGLRHRF